jgi:hypothetical protein
MPYLLLCDRSKTLVLVSFFKHGIGTQSLRIATHLPTATGDNAALEYELHETTSYYSHQLQVCSTCLRIYRKVSAESVLESTTSSSDLRASTISSLSDTLPMHDTPEAAWEIVLDRHLNEQRPPQNVWVYSQLLAILDSDKFRVVKGKVHARSPSLEVDSALFTGSFKLDCSVSQSIVPLLQIANVSGLRLRAIAAQEERGTTMRLKPTKFGLLIRQYCSGVCLYTTDAIFNQTFATTLGAFGACDAMLIVANDAQRLALVVCTLLVVVRDGNV